MKKARCFKFSMVELLLVVAVFSILSLLLCTAGEAAKKDAKLAICAANMKELVKMIHLYDAEHGQLPPVWVPAKPLWYFWSKHLDPSPLRNKLFCCPSDIRSAHMYEETDPLSEEIRMSHDHSYGMNATLHTYNPAKPPTFRKKLARPERTIVLGDGIGPILQPRDKFGVPRHGNRYHYVTVSGAQRLLTGSELGTIKNGILTNPKKEDWSL